MVRAVVVAGLVALGAGAAVTGVVDASAGPGGGPPTVSVVHEARGLSGGVLGGEPGGGSTGERGGEQGGEPGGEPGRERARPVLRPPLDPPVTVARPFDGPAQPWASGHRGVDLATEPARAVHAPGGGLVSFSGTVVDRGVVTITHDDGLRSSLEPVVPAVRAGQRVLPGQVVGSVASTPGHCAPATCLHWGLRRGETYLDPMQWVLDRGPVVLLPER